MKNTPVVVTSVAQLNTKEVYILNHDIETYNYNGKVTIPAGSNVNFLSLTSEDSFVIVRTTGGLIEKVHISFLNDYSNCLLGKIVCIPEGLNICTHDGVFQFEPESKYEVQAVFYTNHGQYRPEEKTYFIRYINDNGELTAATGTVPHHMVELV